MADLIPEKLHVSYKDSVDENKLIIPRKYTLTHSDSTGDLFLTIGADYDYAQISSLYTRFMRDEVLAEWKKKKIITSFIFTCILVEVFVLAGQE